MQIVQTNKQKKPLSYHKRQWSDADVFRCGLYLVQFVINISQQLSAINALMLQINMFMGGKKGFISQTQCADCSLCVNIYLSQCSVYSSAHLVMP